MQKLAFVLACLAWAGNGLQEGGVRKIVRGDCTRTPSEAFLMLLQSIKGSDPNAFQVTSAAPTQRFAMRPSVDFRARSPVAYGRGWNLHNKYTVSNAKGEDASASTTKQHFPKATMVAETMPSETEAAEWSTTSEADIELDEEGFPISMNPEESKADIVRQRGQILKQRREQANAADDPSNTQKAQPLTAAAAPMAPSIPIATATATATAMPPEDEWEEEVEKIDYRFRWRAAQDAQKIAENKAAIEKRSKAATQYRFEWSSRKPRSKKHFSVAEDAAQVAAAEKAVALDKANTLIIQAAEETMAAEAAVAAKDAKSRAHSRAAQQSAHEGVNQGFEQNVAKEEQKVAEGEVVVEAERNTLKDALERAQKSVEQKAAEIRKMRAKIEEDEQKSLEDKAAEQKRVAEAELTAAQKMLSKIRAKQNTLIVEAESVKEEMSRVEKLSEVARINWAAEQEAFQKKQLHAEEMDMLGLIHAEESFALKGVADANYNFDKEILHMEMSDAKAELAKAKSLMSATRAKQIKLSMEADALEDEQAICAKEKAEAEETLRLAAEKWAAAQMLEAKPSKGSKQDLSKLKVPELKEKLKAAGLKVSGNKAELISRLEDRAATFQTSVDDPEAKASSSEWDVAEAASRPTATAKPMATATAIARATAIPIEIEDDEDDEKIDYRFSWRPKVRKEKQTQMARAKLEAEMAAKAQEIAEQRAASIAQKVAARKALDLEIENSKLMKGKGIEVDIFHGSYFT